MTPAPAPSYPRHALGQILVTSHCSAESPQYCTGSTKEIEKCLFGASPRVIFPYKNGADAWFRRIDARQPLPQLRLC